MLRSLNTDYSLDIYVNTLETLETAILVFPEFLARYVYMFLEDKIAIMGTIAQIENGWYSVRYDAEKDDSVIYFPKVALATTRLEKIYAIIKRDYTLEAKFFESFEELDAYVKNL